MIKTLKNWWNGMSLRYVEDPPELKLLKSIRQATQRSLVELEPGCVDYDKRRTKCRSLIEEVDKKIESYDKTQ